MEKNPEPEEIIKFGEASQALFGMSKREQTAWETGKDPKNGLSFKPKVLSDQVEERGRQKSRRKIRRVWVDADV